MYCTNTEEKLNKKNNRFCFISRSQYNTNIDTSYVDSLDFNLKKLTLVHSKYFENVGLIEKYAQYEGVVDAQYVCYYTKEFGVIYYKDITWGGFSKLHSTNDSIQNKLNNYFDFILSSQSLVCAGEDYLKYCDTIIKLGSIRERRCIINDTVK